MSIAHSACQLDRLTKIQPDFSRRVRIRAKGEGHSHARRQFKNSAIWIHFLAVFPQPGGIDFDRYVVPARLLEEAFNQMGAILFRIEAEFFAKISVANDVEQL